MNNAKMWLVVKPTVGIPLFLSAVAIGSFAVHVAVLSKVTWYNDYLTGQPLGASAASASLQSETGSATVASAPTGTGSGQAIVITMPDGSIARAVLESEATLASLAGPGAHLPRQ